MGTWAGALVLITVAVLAPSASVWAECAWVLWVKETMYSDPNPKDGQWGRETTDRTPIEASPREAECRQKLQDIIKRITHPEEAPRTVKMLYKVTGGDSVTLLFYAKDGKPTDTPTHSQVLSYFCLPDTVDPRGPRGAK
jgi:hypothetical protein